LLLCPYGKRGSVKKRSAKRVIKKSISKGKSSGAKAATKQASSDFESKMRFKTTDDIKVPQTVIEQVIGQEDAVRIIRKAASQRRNVLLIGEPGTGKSMLGLGLSELLPKGEVKDILVFPNLNDETPLVTPCRQKGKLFVGSKLSNELQGRTCHV
jgi:predicted ATP-dependent protease